MDDPWIIGTLMTLGFVAFFAGMWWLVTKIIVRMSGWPDLQMHFPDQPHESAIEKWSMATAVVGRSAVTGVSFRNSLVVEACQSGLRVTIWRILAPSAEPIFVPWSQINTEKGVLGSTLLALGEPEKGCLRIRAALGRKIEAASRGQFTMPAA